MTPTTLICRILPPRSGSATARILCVGLMGLSLAAGNTPARAQTSRRGPGARAASASERQARQRAQKRRERTRDILRLLERRVERVEFDETPLREVVAWFKSQGLKNLIVSWKALERTGALSPDTPITLLLQDVRLGDVLDAALSQASDEVMLEEDELTYHVDNGVLKISTRADFGRRLYTRTYYVEDLLQPALLNELLPFIQIGQQFAYVAELDPAVAGGSAAQRPIIDVIDTGSHHGPGDPEYGRADFKTIRQDELDKLIALLKTIKPRTWDERGGRGTISAFGQKLIISQTIEMHEIIGGAFEQVEALRRRRKAGP